jgi:hypothetical protein
MHQNIRRLQNRIRKQAQLQLCRRLPFKDVCIGLNSQLILPPPYSQKSARPIAQEAHRPTFHCVILPKYPVLASQLRIHINSECCRTRLCSNITLRFGSNPIASSAASISLLRIRNVPASCRCVIACRSTVQKISLVDWADDECWRSTHWRRAPR